MDKIQRGSKRNFFMVDNAVFSDKLELEPLDKLVYVCLLRYADNNSKEAFPAMQRIASDCSISRKRVNQAIKVLEQKKLIEKKQRFDKAGSKKSNLYTVFDANEVINTMSPQVTYHVTTGDIPCNPELHNHVTTGDNKKTDLKILNEEERPSVYLEIAKKNIKQLKEQVK